MAKGNEAFFEEKIKDAICTAVERSPEKTG